MKLSGIVLAVFITISGVVLSEAQPAPHGPIPQGIEALRQSASSKAEFTLDHSMLVFASKLSPDNEDLRRVIAGVSGVSVHSYHFAGHWTYDPQALELGERGLPRGRLEAVDEQSREGWEPGGYRSLGSLGEQRGQQRCDSGCGASEVDWFDGNRIDQSDRSVASRRAFRYPED